MLTALLRNRLCKTLTGERRIALERRKPTRDEVARRYEAVGEFGMYLHVPFCRQICPYCPYNKELFHPDAAESYTRAVKKEMDFYSGIVGRRAVTSLYIGGGTPTTMLRCGLEDILDHLRRSFNVRCDIHMESHPNDLTSENLDRIFSMGVRHLSTGVEALQDRHLRTLRRPYTARGAREAVDRALGKGFQCVNVDVMFALPGQTCADVEETGRALVAMGVHQVAAYPLFRFPYTPMGEDGRAGDYGLRTVLKRRKMLRILERIFYSSGFERTSVWAFTRAGTPRYCSVTVPLYMGLGPSGGSYLKDAFYVNTFSVAEYVKAIEESGTAVALWLDLPPRMEMAGWLYWRMYETRIRKGDFESRFGREFDREYGKYFKLLGLLGFSRDRGDEIVLTDRGSYWLHALEDVFSIEYISRLWGTSEREPWPERIVLEGRD